MNFNPSTFTESWSHWRGLTVQAGENFINLRAIINALNTLVCGSLWTSIPLLSLILGLTGVDWPNNSTGWRGGGVVQLSRIHIYSHGPKHTPLLSQYKQAHSPEYLSQCGLNTADGQNEVDSALSSQYSLKTVFNYIPYYSSQAI